MVLDACNGTLETARSCTKLLKQGMFVECRTLCVFLRDTLLSLVKVY